MFCVPLPQVVALGPWSTKSNNEIINGQTVNGLIHSLLGSPHYHNSNQTIRSRTIEVKPLEQISQLYDKAFFVIYRDTIVYCPADYNFCTTYKVNGLDPMVIMKGVCQALQIPISHKNAI